MSLFNALNANAVLTQTNTYGPALCIAITILPARLLPSVSCPSLACC